MDENDKISSEHKQENTVITITQPPTFLQDQSQTNNSIGINEIGININVCWQQWKDKFLSIVQSFVPLKKC